jgi:hypothetical protein
VQSPWDGVLVHAGGLLGGQDLYTNFISNTFQTFESLSHGRHFGLILLELLLLYGADLDQLAHVPVKIVHRLSLAVRQVLPSCVRQTART